MQYVYHYDPLDDPGELRLIRILPGKPDDAVECELEHTNADNPKAYECLSYVWGDTSVTRPILLNECPFNVTTNLEAALRHLQPQDHIDDEEYQWFGLMLYV